MLLLATALGGCQSLATVMTQVDLGMAVVVIGENAPESGSLYFRESPRMWAFDHPGYRDEALEWWIQVPLDGVSLQFTSHAGRDLTLRWDQSRWRSSGHPEFIPLRVYRFSTGFHPDGETLISVPDGNAATTPAALELKPGASLRLSFEPEYRPLFETGHSFGIQRVEQGQGFTDDGIGRWLELELPVEAGAHSWTYRIRLTARDIAQWNSYR